MKWKMVVIGAIERDHDPSYLQHTHSHTLKGETSALKTHDTFIREQTSLLVRWKCASNLCMRRSASSEVWHFHFTTPPR